MSLFIYVFDKTIKNVIQINNLCISPILALHSFEGIGAIWLWYTKNAWTTGGWNSAGSEPERGGLQ